VLERTPSFLKNTLNRGNDITDYFLTSSRIILYSPAKIFGGINGLTDL